ncbi:transposon Tf2-11 polyprotein [Trichonephila clavipes]|nr:transposon Tf2-11 polyprotein [Trichonephila clavipes]
MEQQIADLLRQNQDLIRALQIRDDSHSHKVTVQFEKSDEENENFDNLIERFETYLDVQNVPIANRAKPAITGFREKTEQNLNNLLREYKDIFDDKLGEISNYQAKLKLRPGVKPIFCRVRTVPFALKGTVEKEIDRLETEGIIEKVDSSEWATPVVPVVKTDGSIRLCADYSVTLNPNLIVPQHPLPILEEIFATVANLLNNLTKKNVRFLRSKDCQVAFEQIKKEICSPKVLVHYDLSLPLTLASDASPVGIGCVLSHIYPEVSERPNAFASRTLSGSKKKYFQIDKEALSIVWALKMFYLYLKVRRFTLITDHKLLIAIFGSKRGLPVLAAIRLLHYALLLQSFEFDIIFRKTIEHGNADFLSRLPKTSGELEVKDDVPIFQMS